MCTMVVFQSHFYLIGKTHARVMCNKTTERVLLISNRDPSLRISK